MNAPKLTTKTYDIKNLFLDQEERYIKFLIGYFLATVDAPNSNSTTFRILDKRFKVAFLLQINWDYSLLCQEYPRIKDDVELLQEDGNPGAEHIQEQTGVVIAMILSSIELNRRVVEFTTRSAPDLKLQKSPLEGVEAAARTGSIKQTIFGSKKKRAIRATPRKKAKGRAKSTTKQKDVGKWNQLYAMPSISSVHLSVLQISKNEIFWEKVK